MANFSIKIDLQQLEGAFLTNLKGKTTTKKCICIPVDDAHLYVGEKGIYLDLTAIAVKEARYGDTHCIKQNLPKDIYEMMTEEDKKALPILGNMHELKKATQEVNTVTEGTSTDDLPF